MKKTKYIRKFFWAEPYDIKAIEEFLEQKAAEGLMLVKFRGKFYYFEECEPKKVRFQIDYFKKAMVFDTNPELETRKYIDFCEECGWTYLQGEGKMQIFYTEDETIPPLQTDSKALFRNIIKNTLIFTCIQWIFLPLTQLINLGSSIHRLLYGGPYGIANFFAGGFDMLCIGIFGIYILLSIYMNARFVEFILRNVKRVKAGEELQFFSHKNVVRSRNTVVTAVVLMMFGVIGMFMSLGQMGIHIGIICAICAGVILTILLMSLLTYWKKANRTFNIVVNVVGSIVLCAIMIGGTLGVVLGMFGGTVKGEDGTIYITSNDSVPVTLEMLGVNKDEYSYQYEDKEVEEKGTPLASQNCYSHFLMSDGEEELPYYSMEIFESRFDWINDKYREAWQHWGIETTKLNQDVAEAWAADEIYMVKGEYVERFMIIKENKTVIIEGTYPDTDKAKTELSSLYQ